MSESDKLQVVMAQLVSALAATTSLKTTMEFTGKSVAPEHLVSEYAISPEELRAWQAAEAARVAHQMQCDGYVALKK